YNDYREKCELQAGLMITLGQKEQEVADLTQQKETLTTEVSKLKERILVLEGGLKLAKEDVAALGGEKTKME
ncbi:hypothetical protein A2U01_0108094, partial [Trifolium medium]|nr:hypothetical protein [Trifolium medium]